METYLARMIKEFQTLAAMDSISYEEAQIADYIKKQLQELGFELYEDHAGQTYQGNANNIYGFLKGTKKENPVLFSAHMDTVSPGKGKKPVIKEDGTITSDGTTVLGADDIAGIVEILEALREIKEENTEHRDIEVLFTIAEEMYVKGSEVFDFSKIRAKEAYVLDLSGEIGTAAYKAPSLISFTVCFTGKEAHAGFAPEEGIHAIHMAADAIRRIPSGHVNKDTTINIGTIAGGTGDNIVPKECYFTGEVRSFDHEQALNSMQMIKTVCENAAKQYNGMVAIKSTVHFKAYETEQSEPVIRRFLKACEQNSLSGKLTETFGGSDNHNFMSHGIKGIVLACGMHQVHTCKEYTVIKELDTMTKLVKELMTEED